MNTKRMKKMNNKTRKNKKQISAENPLIKVLKIGYPLYASKAYEGSFLVGSILKELYVDSALKKADKLNANEEPKPEPKKPEVKISYKQFKKMNK